MLLAFLALQLSAAAPRAEPVRFELANGLRVWVQEDHSRPVALVQVTYKVGSLQEGPGHTGIAHYVEHMVYRATRNIRNEDVYGYIDRIGGRYTGGTWPEFTRYTETVPSWALESALRVTAERMCCALFDSLEFERERSNVVTEASGFADVDAINVFRDALMAATFELHPYRYSSNTWARDNLVLTRDEAFAWYRRYYGPNNAVLVVVGDVTTSAVRQMVERHFGGIARAPASGMIVAREPPQVTEKRIVLRHRGAAQQLVLLYHAPAASDTLYPLARAASRHLAARLPGVLKSAGIANVKLTVEDSAAPYPFLLRIAAEADSGVKLDAVLALIDAEIGRLAREGPSEGELVAARAGAASQVGERTEARSDGVPPRRSSLTALADEMSDGELFPWDVDPRLLARIVARAGRVTSAEIRDYARRWLRGDARTVGLLVSDPTATFVEAPPEIPPLTTPPARRLRPEPVPARGLDPLAPLAIHTTRSVLRNGVVVRTATTRDSAAHVRIALADGADSAAVAALIASEATLGTGTRVSWAIGSRRVRDSAQARVLRALPGDSGRVGGGAVTIGIAGAREPGRVHATVSSALARLPARRNGRGGLATPYVNRGEERAVIAGERQVSIAAGLPGVARDHPDRRALELLNYIVGVPSYGGRLGWALTKAGLTYASAANTTFGDGTGQIVFSTRCDSRNTDATVQAIREVVEGVGAAGVEGWELDEAKAFMLGRTILYGARDDSDNRAVAAALAESEAMRLELLDLPALSRAYLSVSLEDINRVARRYYRPELLKVVAAGAIPAGPERIFPAGTFRALFVP